MSVVEQWKPDSAAMRRHLTFLFDQFPDGWIELAWHDPIGDDGQKRWHASWHKVTEIDALVDEATVRNSVPGQNVYVGAAVRDPACMPGGRSNDADAWALPALYTDLDDEQSIPVARDKWNFHKPNLIVVTGVIPHKRAQAYWKLEEPLRDHAAWRAALRAMARHLGGDMSVTNPGRILRLAGTIAWPTKPGRQVELTGIVHTTSDPPPRPAYGVKGLMAVYPYDPADLQAQHTAPIDSVVTRTPNALGLDDRISDGREKYMTRTLFAVFVEFCGTNGCAPTVDELVEDAWPQYERHVDLSRPGRGKDEFRRKAAYLIQRFENGEIRGMATVEEVIDAFRGRRQQQAVEYAASGFDSGPEPAPAEDDAPFAAIEFQGEPPAMRWLVTEWIPQGVIVALYGDGGVGKTLLAQQLLYAAGVGGEWLGMPVPQVPALGVFCEDDRDELHRRHDAVKASLGYTVGNPFDQVWIWPRVGFDNLLVTFDRDNRPTMSPFFNAVMKHTLEKRIGLLVLDTVADLYGGNEIIRTQVNFFIKSTCGAFIRRAKEAGFELTIVLLAHPSQSGKESGRGDGGSTAWSNAVRARLYLTRPEDGGPNDRILSRKKSNYSASGDDTALELVWRDGTIQRRTVTSGLPDRQTCLAMVEAIREAWFARVPLSMAPQTKTDGRWAPRVLARRFSLAEKDVSRLIERWLEERILRVAQCNSDTKMRGLEVIGSLTEVTEVRL